jgi:apolipoprotein N-acyltransferase
MMVQKKHGFLPAYWPAVTSGLLLTLSFPGPGLWWFAFFALVPLLMSIRTMEPNQAFYCGFACGLVHFLTLVYWIVPTVHVYGGLHPVLAVCTLVLLSLYLALFPAVFAFASRKLNPYPWFRPLFVSCLWVGLEYIRTYAFTGFAWGSLGYSQFSNPTFIQIADFSGVYGVSFLIVLVNCLATDLWTAFQKKRGQFPQKILTVPFVYTLFLVAGALVYGSLRMNVIDDCMQAAETASITVVQGNIEQDLKWSDAFKEKTVEKYIRLSSQESKKNPDLVIWPETALPFYYGVDRLLSNRVDACVRSSRAHFLIGSPAYTSAGGRVRFYNRAYMLNRFSIVTGTYDKTHLVPFGEYVPLGEVLTFLGKITAQAGNFSPGDSRFIPLEFSSHKTGVLICFEILFPSIAADFVKNGADILTTITNDAWFGRTSAAQQHFSIAVFRAIENRRTVVRSANTGISGFIDPNGRILETTALFQDAAVTRQVPALTRISLYTRYGDVFAGSSLVAICLVFMVKGVRQKLRRH